MSSAPPYWVPQAPLTQWKLDRLSELDRGDFGSVNTRYFARYVVTSPLSYRASSLSRPQHPPKRSLQLNSILFDPAL